jgi:hypothetical protein
MGTESRSSTPNVGRFQHREWQSSIPGGNQSRAVSYRSREAKRRKKAAIYATKGQYADLTKARYYLTKVKKECRCSACGAKLRFGADMVYRKLGPVTLCARCADRDPLVDYRTSLRWEKAKAADPHERARRRRNRPVEDAA